MTKTREEKIRIWKIAKFSQETKEEILNRDKHRCILCESISILQVHHVLFWTETLYNEDRNTEKNWVTVCANCHWEKVHACRKWEWERQECIDYLNTLY